MSAAILSIHTFEPTSKDWAPLLEPLTSNPAVKAVYTGSPIERPNQHVVVTHWSSPEALSAFSRSDCLASLAGVSANGSVHAAHVALEGDAAKVLDAPCTEVVTAYGIEPTFGPQLREFVAKVDAGKLEGYHGYACGETDGEIEDLSGAKGPAAMLLIGWDSKEAHIEAKAKPGPIGENIELIRTARKDLDLYHVNLRKL